MERRSLRILTIGHSYAVSSNRATMRALAKDPAFEVTVAAPASHAGDLRAVVCEPEPESSNLKLVTLSARWTTIGPIFHYHQKDLTKLKYSDDFDVVHMWEEPYILAGYQIARTCVHGAARFCFVTCQNLHKSYPPPFNWMEKEVVQKSQGWIGIGQTVLENSIRRGYPAQKGRIVPLAVETRRFRPKTKSERDSLRRRLGLSEPVIGFVGRLVPAKGLRILMQALELLPASTAWSLLLLGSGDMEPEIKQWSSRHGWAGRVRVLLVKHDEVPEYLPVMDMLVAPSQTTSAWREQFGRMIIEAFASGVPVIASDSGEIPHLVADAGSIVPERDLVRWSGEIARYLREPELRGRMAALGLSRAVRFSVDEAARMHREYFCDLTGLRPDGVSTAAEITG
jgi:glycosyltransferase involved in cell wall biosynthesis